MKILVYVRPISDALFRKIVCDVFGENVDVDYISDFRNNGDIWSGDYIYNRKYDYNDMELMEQIDDIICRDRSLRTMEITRAERLVRRYWNGVEELFANISYDYFLTVNVDCYGIDILLRKAEKYKVKSISFLGSFLNGYIWFNLRGERNTLNRKVSQDELDNIYNQLTQKKYLPQSESRNVKRGHKDIIEFYFRRKLIETILYPLVAFIMKDPDNYHYNMINWRGVKLRDIYNKDFESVFTRVSEVNINNTNTVYMPLHFIPEATTDYWCDDVPKYTYEGYVFNVIKKSDANIQFLIKEHPAMYGKRKLSFYNDMSKLPNVRIIHPLDSSNELLEKIDTVVVDNGTVGVEALLRNKRVLALSRNYYDSLHPNLIRVDSVTMEMLNKPITMYDNKKFVRDLLESLAPSDYVNDKYQNRCDSKAISRGIALLLKEKGWLNE